MVESTWNNPRQRFAKTLMFRSNNNNNNHNGIMLIIVIIKLVSFQRVQLATLFA